MNKYAHLAPPPHPQPRLVNMCAGKVRLTTLTKARHAVTAMERKHAGERFTPYFCPLCNRYHIGHAPQTGGAA